MCRERYLHRNYINMTCDELCPTVHTRTRYIRALTYISHGRTDMIMIAIHFSSIYL